MVEIKTKNLCIQKDSKMLPRYQQNAVFEAKIVKYELDLSIVGEALPYLGHSMIDRLFYFTPPHFGFVETWLMGFFCT